MTTCNQLKCATNSENDLLIVDFPAGGRNNFNCDNFPSATCTSSSKPNVQFSPTCTLTYILKPPPNEIEMMWSSSKDRKIARQRQRLEVFHMRNMLDSIGDDAIISDDKLILCIGIENLLSDKLVKRTLEHRKNHLRKVLSEQQRQRDLGTCDDESLGRVSEMSSQKSRFRAFKLADGYSKIL
ncbi:hypothetical protein ACHAXS_000913 [Conticribra weissflogii]